jgi:hypothetical protein
VVLQPQKVLLPAEALPLPEAQPPVAVPALPLSRVAARSLALIQFGSVVDWLSA